MNATTTTTRPNLKPATRRPGNSTTSAVWNAEANVRLGELLAAVEAARKLAEDVLNAPGVAALDAVCEVCNGSGMIRRVQALATILGDAATILGQVRQPTDAEREEFLRAFKLSSEAA